MTQSSLRIPNMSRNIRSAMALNGLTQAKLAKRLGIAPSSLSNKLSGSIRFSAEEIAVMADVLHTSTDQLLGRGPMEVSSCAGH